MFSAGFDADVDVELLPCGLVLSIDALYQLVMVCRVHRSVAFTTGRPHTTRIHAWRGVTLVSYHGLHLAATVDTYHQQQ